MEIWIYQQGHRSQLLSLHFTIDSPYACTSDRTVHTPVNRASTVISIT